MRTLKASLVLILLLTPCLAQAGWVQLISGTTESLNSVYFPMDTETGYAVGGALYPPSAVILKTTNGGGTWIAQNPGTHLRLRGVHFPTDALTGYAVGDTGIILKTTNGGTTWAIQASGTRYFLYGVCFPADAQTGYAVGEVGTILKTTDGGMTWEEKHLISGIFLFGVHYPTDAQTGYVAGGWEWPNRESIILKTTNSGATWLECWWSSNEGPLYAVHFPRDTRTGYAVGVDLFNCALVTKSTDGGATWERRGTGSKALCSVYFPVDDQTGYVSGEDGFILKTTDGGTTWAGQTSGTTNRLNTIHFPIDTHTGYAVGETGTILKTTDGGTWVEDIPEVRGQRIEVRSTATPNPFTNQTLIQYSLPSSSPVRLSIYNISGQLIKTLAREVEPPGLHARRWDGRDEQGKRVAAGVYFYRLEAGGYTATNKIILLR